MKEQQPRRKDDLPGLLLLIMVEECNVKTGKMVLCLFLCVLLLQGCEANKDTGQKERETDYAEETLSFYAMDDLYVTVTAYKNREDSHDPGNPDAEEAASQAVSAAREEVERLDALLSTGKSDSQVAKLNANGGGRLSEDTGYLLERSLSFYKETHGAFDVAIYPVMKAWGFTTKEYRIPEKRELKECLALADPGEIIYDKEKSRVDFARKGMQIDFGGIAKGYMSTRIMDIWKQSGIESGLVNLAGNVQVLGTKPDGSLWKIGVRDPDGDSSSYLGILSVRDTAVITSGGYERYFEKNGRRYHHIIDPKTGYPAEAGLKSVTVVCSDGARADALSTSLFIMGRDEAIDYWKEHSEELDVILYGEDETLYVSEGIAGQFQSDKRIEVISAG